MHKRDRKKLDISDILPLQNFPGEGGGSTEFPGSVILPVAVLPETLRRDLVRPRTSEGIQVSHRTIPCSIGLEIGDALLAFSEEILLAYPRTGVVWEVLCHEFYTELFQYLLLLTWKGKSGPVSGSGIPV